MSALFEVCFAFVLLLSGCRECSTASLKSIDLDKWNYETEEHIKYKCGLGDLMQKELVPKIMIDGNVLSTLEKYVMYRLRFRDVIASALEECLSKDNYYKLLVEEFYFDSGKKSFALLYLWQYQEDDADVFIISEADKILKFFRKSEPYDFYEKETECLLQLENSIFGKMKIESVFYPNEECYVEYIALLP